MAFRLFKRKAKYRPPVIRKRLASRLAEVGRRLVTLTSLLILLALLGAIGWSVYQFVFFSTFFQLHEINISSILTTDATDTDLTDTRRKFSAIREELLEMLEESGISDNNLLLIAPEEVSKVVEAHSMVRSVKVRKHPPDRMEIDVELRQAVALIAANGILAIDRDGVIIGSYATYEDIATQHPFITGLELPDETPGSQIASESLTKALLLLSSLSVGIPSLTDKISECHCGNENELTLVLTGGTEIRFGAENPLSRMPALETFLDGLQAPLEQYAYIDLSTEGLVFYRSKAETAQDLGSQSASKVPEAP